VATKVVIIGGCGHAGLPLGAVLADQAGCDVTLLDINPESVRRVNAAEAPFMETGLPELLRKVVGKTLHATTDDSCLRECEIAISIIATPVDRHLNPIVHETYSQVDSIINAMPADSLLILRSTVYPGVTELVYKRIKTLGRHIHLAFCPERIAEGKALKELVELPQVVGAFEPEAMERATKFFSRIVATIIPLNPLEAELAKLFTNSWRYLNFAISNQFYSLCHMYGVDFYRIYDAVTRDYPRMTAFARPGFAAGPCLLKDTLQLAAFSNNSFFLGHAAMLVNEGLPNLILERLKADNLSEKKVAILGMAFKAESDDKRDSLSYKLKNLLQVYAKEVLCTDPYVADPALVPLETCLAQADVFVLGAPHSAYRELKFTDDKIIVDVWGVWAAAKNPSQQSMAKAGTK
jgi:UDP-N-acetyl-D-mannosaminuronic acid dehydrogenase